jgi:carbon monoxide dehydrogenase subunit G
MQFSGSYTFDAEQQTVWEVLMDSQAIANALPGVDELIPVDNEPDTWRADAKIGIAMVSGTYSGRIKMSEVQAPRQYRLTVSGEGQQSIINGTALITLEYNEQTRRTHLTWEAEANVSGKLASVGQRVFGPAAHMMSRRFFKSLANQIPEDQRTSSSL